jgi:uncharacterized protein
MAEEGRAKRRIVDLNGPLTAKERAELESLMAVRDPDCTGPMEWLITRVHGFLTSVLSGPMILPSEWLPLVFGDDEEHPWETMEQAQRATNLLMRFYNETADALATDGRRPTVMIDRFGEPPDTIDLADDWCIGYMLGVALREDEWSEALEAPDLEEAFFSILLIADPEKPPDLDPEQNPKQYAEMIALLPWAVQDIHEWWKRKLAHAS